MTILVYDPPRDTFFVDSYHTVFGGFKSVKETRTKVLLSRGGHKYVSSGEGSNESLGLEVGLAVAAYIKDVRYVIDCDPAGCDLFVRTSDGVALVSHPYGEKKMILVPPPFKAFPYSRASGSFFFDAYFVEHQDVDLAMDLTCRFAHGCGLPIESF